MKILLKSVLARFKVVLGAVPLIASTYTIGTLVQPRVIFAISQNRDNLSLVNTVQWPNQNISQKSFNVNKNNLELKHSNYFIISQNQGINTDQNSQLKNSFNVVPSKHQGGNFPNQYQWNTTNTNNNQLGIEQVNKPQVAAPINPIIPRSQPMLTNIRPQPVVSAPVNPRPRPQPIIVTNVRPQPVALTAVNPIIPRPKPIIVTNVRPQPVAPVAVNPIIPRPQPIIVTNVRPQPVAPVAVNPLPRPQPTIKNLYPVVPAPQPVVKNLELVTPAPELQPAIATPHPMALTTQPSN